MEFVFEVLPLTRQLVPDIEHMAICWAVETKYGNRVMDNETLAEFLSHTYKSERWTAWVALGNLSKIITLRESNSLSGEEQETLDKGVSLLQREVNPGENFWKLLAHCPLPPIEEQYETVTQHDAEVAEQFYTEASVELKALQKAILSQNRPVVYFAGLQREERF